MATIATRLAWLCAFLSVVTVGGHAGAGSKKATPVRLFLCDSAPHAILFADGVATGDSEEMAKDRVGRSAAPDACGLYRGVATIESRSITLKDGIAYKLTAYRFREDRALAWLAERNLGPVDPAWNL